ncbi:Leucine-rich repeat [Macleaya cordata]|uniref:Leucine-rich repeat n=1 Tax=Macleaya cordata TaxID=56857 RepID=A0A200PPP9_MACCD|nr:Leucine-rich repeat [Macleaya cordata]
MAVVGYQQGTVHRSTIRGVRLRIGGGDDGVGRARAKTLRLQDIQMLIVFNKRVDSKDDENDVETIITNKSKHDDYTDKAKLKLNQSVLHGESSLKSLSSGVQLICESDMIHSLATHILWEMAREAVDRSCGQLVEFSVEHFTTDELLEYIADSFSSRAMFLALAHRRAAQPSTVIEMRLWNLGWSKFGETMRMVELENLCFSAPIAQVILSLEMSPAFTLLSGYRFRLIEMAKKLPMLEEPQLRHLHLFGNFLTNNGLRAILDGCPHLESLDLSQCFNVNLEGDLLKRCTDAGIKNLRLPEDSTDDFEFDATIINFVHDLEF